MGGRSRKDPAEVWEYNGHKRGYYGGILRHLTKEFGIEHIAMLGGWPNGTVKAWANNNETIPKHAAEKILEIAKRRRVENAV